MSFVPFLVAALAATADPVIARIDQETITAAAIARRIDSVAAFGVKLTSTEAVDSLIADVVLAAEGRRLGLADSPRISAFADGAIRKAAAVALLESYVTAREADDATLRAMFHSTADFVAYEFLAYESEKDGRAARERIEKGATLEAEAPRAVTARLYPKPADAPLALRAQLPRPLADALFAAAPGALVGPIEGDNGWILARVAKKEIGTDADFTAKRPALVRSLKKQMLDAARGHLVEQLKAKTGVKLDEAFLRGLSGARPTPEQLQHPIAIVAGAPVRYADVYPSVASLGGQGGHMASPNVKIQLAWSVVGTRLVEAFAIERGFDKTPELVAARRELERQALAQLVIERLDAAVERPKGRDVERHYDANRARFTQPLGKIRPQVEAELLQQRRSDALRARVGELRARSSISIDDAALARASS